MIGKREQTDLQLYGFQVWKKVHFQGGSAAEEKRGRRTWGKSQLCLVNLVIEMGILCVAIVQSLSDPWTASHQASLSFTISWRVLKLMSIESVMPSNHLILCCPLLLLPSVFPSIRVSSNDSSSHYVAKVLKLQLQHQSFQWIFRSDFL